jgi:hypothetical protein
MLVCTETVCTEDIGCDWDFLPLSSPLWKLDYDSKEFNEAYNGIDKFFKLIKKEKDTFAKNYN